MVLIKTLLKKVIFNPPYTLRRSAQGLRAALRPPFLGAFLALALALQACAVPQAAVEQVVQPLPENWPELVLSGLEPKARELAIKYEPDGVTFREQVPQPCVFSPAGGAKAFEAIKGYCGNLLVTPAGRTKLPPVNFIYLINDQGVEFILQD
jgi:hypothetical protein